MFHNNFSVLKGWQGLFKKKKGFLRILFYFIITNNLWFNHCASYDNTVENSPNLSPTEELLNMLKKQVCAE